MFRVTPCDHDGEVPPTERSPVASTRVSLRQADILNGTVPSLQYRSKGVEHPVGVLEFSLPSLPQVSFGPIPSLNAQIPSIPTLAYPCCLSCCDRDCWCCGCPTLMTPSTHRPSRTHSRAASGSSSPLSTTLLPASPPHMPTSTGSFCQSGSGIQAQWVWVNEESGLVQWRLSNPTETDAVVVLNRGVVGSGWYAFGNAFWPAYLETGLTHIGTGPYTPIQGHQRNLPLAVIGPQQPGIAFVFPLRAGTQVTVDEGGYAGSQPYCHELVDVRFLYNAPYQVTYNVEFQCRDFTDTTVCPPNPYTNTFAVYMPIDGSMQGAYGPSTDDLLMPAIIVRTRPQSPRQGHCLPGSAYVRTSNGSMRALRELQTGEWIWTRSLSDAGHQLLTRVYAFADYDPEAQHIPYLRLVTERGTVELSPHHLVYVKKSSDTAMAFVPASDIRPGSGLMTDDGSIVYVRRIEAMISTGALAPLTEAGTLLVNGHLVSCYSGRVSQAWAHTSFLPLRVYHQAMGYVPNSLRRRAGRWMRLSTATTPMRTGIHIYALWLMQMCRILGPLCPARDVV